MREKLLPIQEAVALIPSGASLAIGGSILRRHPLGFLREMVRQGKTGLHLFTWTSGLAVDFLVGAGCVSKVEAAYVGLDPFGLAQNFRRAVERGEIAIEDFTESSMIARFRAASMGLPCLPTMALLGTDMAERTTLARPITCPFTGQPMHMVAAARAEYTILHGFTSDVYG
ncbi:MAG: CoA transferase subunit A, partial [Nitrospinota bacterium]